MSNKLFLSSGSVTATALFIFANPLAQAADLSSENKKFETVYVSATRSETAPLPVATQIKVIGADDIRRSGATLLSEVLRTQAGIQLSDADGSGARNVTVSMRGLSGSNNVLVLVDGRKLNNPSSAGPAINTIALKDVERIEIVQGSAGVLYGDQAVGGVINVITRRAVTGEINGTVGALAGSDNLEDYTASVNQGFQNGLSYNLSAQKRNADNYRENNQTAYENLLGNIRYDLERGFVFVEGQQVDDELRLPGGISDAQAELDPRHTNSPNDYSNQYTDTFRVGGGFSFNQAWSLFAEYSDRNEEGEYVYSPSLTEYSMRVKSLTPRLVGEFTTDNGQSVFTLGYDHIDSDYESNNGWSPVNSTQQQRSYYAQVVYPVLRNLTATAGARFAQVDDKNYLLNEQQKDDLTASELGLNYQLNSAWRLYGRYAESFRFANPDSNNLVPAGIIFLAPQTGESFELGTQWSGETAQVSYALYHLTLNDEIVFDGIQFANINLPDSERQGFTLDASRSLGDVFDLQVNYTYTDAEVVDGAYEGKVVPFVAEHSGSLVAVMNPRNDVTLSLESVYTGARFKADDEANSGEKLSSVTVFNFNALYQYREWDFSARVNNITNERYVGYHSVWSQYPQPERNYQVGVAYRF